MDWIGLDWIGLDRIGLDWIGPDWIGLGWTGLDWTNSVCKKISLLPLIVQGKDGVLMAKENIRPHLEAWSEIFSCLATTKYEDEDEDEDKVEEGGSPESCGRWVGWLHCLHHHQCQNTLFNIYDI